MGKRRSRPAENPLLKDRVAAIAEPVDRSKRTAQMHAQASSDIPLRISDASKPRRTRSTVQVKARFSRDESEEIERLTRTLSSYLGTRVMGSEVTRALWTLVIRSQDEFASLSDKMPKLERPSYGNPIAMAEYEDAIAEFLLLALKQTRRSG